MAIDQTISPSHVKEVINTDLDDQSIEALIAASSALIRNRLASVSLSGDTQIEILRWTAAHFVAIKGSVANSGATGTTGVIVAEKLGEASITYGGARSFTDTSIKTDYTNLKGTMWGQTAMSFDPSGILGNLGNRPMRMVSL